MNSDLTLPGNVIVNVAQGDRKAVAPPRHRAGERFLKGPIPMGWLTAAMALPGRTLAVGVWLWHVAGMRRNATVPINLSRMPIQRSAAGRGLAALERAGLVSVLREPGRRPEVTLLPWPVRDTS